MRPDGSKQQNLTKNDLDHRVVTWTPDGQVLMYEGTGITYLLKLIDPADPKATKGTITVETKSLHIENKGMKETLHGPDWLDVAKNPKIDFAIKKVTESKSAGDNVFDLTVVGDLTCKGVTKELIVPVKATYLPGKLGERSSKMTGDLLVLRANFVMKRKDFGIKPDMTDKVVAEEIQLRVSIAGVSPKK